MLRMVTTKHLNSKGFLHALPLLLVSVLVVGGVVGYLVVLKPHYSATRPQQLAATSTQIEWKYLSDGPGKYLFSSPSQNNGGIGMPNRGQAVIATDPTDGKKKLYSLHAERNGHQTLGSVVYSLDIYDFSSSNWQTFNLNTDPFNGGSCTYFHRTCPHPVPGNTNYGFPVNGGTSFVYHGGKIYSMAYEDTLGAYIPNGIGMVSFDIKSKTWSRAGRLGDWTFRQIDDPYFPVKNMELIGENTSDPKILVFSQGEVQGADSIKVYTYSIKNKTFSQKSSYANVRREYSTVKFVDEGGSELVYLVGGWSRKGNSDPIFQESIPYYDIAEDRWHDGEANSEDMGDLNLAEIKALNTNFGSVIPAGVVISALNYSNDYMVLHASNIYEPDSGTGDSAVWHDALFVYSFGQRKWLFFEGEDLTPDRAGPGVVIDPSNSNMYVYGGYVFDLVDWSTQGKQNLWTRKFGYVRLKNFLELGSTLTSTPAPKPTSTPIPTSTPTSTPIPTSTPTPTDAPMSTPSPTSTPVATNTPTPTPPSGGVISAPERLQKICSDNPNAFIAVICELFGF